MGKQKAIVLENGFKMDIPEGLTSYLHEEGIEWKWYDMRERFWPENREETIKYFSSLPIGQKLYCHTTFDGWQQLELMIQLLYKLKEKKFELHIMNPSLCNNLRKFLEESESSICPNTKEYNDSPKKREKLKNEVVLQFYTVMNTHKIFWLNYHRDIQLRTMEDIISNCYEGF